MHLFFGVTSLFHVHTHTQTQFPKSMVTKMLEAFLWNFVVPLVDISTVSIFLCIQSDVCSFSLFFLCPAEPLAVSTVFSVAVGSLIVFMICILLAVYIIKSERCCFRKRSKFRNLLKCTREAYTLNRSAVDKNQFSRKLVCMFGYNFFCNRMKITFVSLELD